jgi:hypothetical protein
MGDGTGSGPRVGSTGCPENGLLSCCLEFRFKMKIRQDFQARKKTRKDKERQDSGQETSLFSGQSRLFPRQNGKPAVAV